MAVGTAILLARVQQDWKICMDWPGHSLALLDDLLDPSLLIWGALPFLPFALAPLRRGQTALPARMLVAAGLLWLWLFWNLHDPGPLHHCDRKGGSREFVALLGSVLAVPLCLLFWPKRGRG